MTTCPSACQFDHAHQNEVAFNAEATEACAIRLEKTNGFQTGQAEDPASPKPSASALPTGLGLMGLAIILVGHFGSYADPDFTAAFVGVAFCIGGGVLAMRSLQFASAKFREVAEAP